MSSSLRSHLRQVADRRLRHTLVQAMSVPWCWPVEPALRKRAEHLGLKSPSLAKPGQSVLVSVTKGSAVGHAWLLEAHEQAAGRWTVPPFDEETWQLLASTERQCFSKLPFATRLPVSPRLNTLRALSPLVNGGIELEGRSFGAGFWIATASRYMDLPARTDTVALACCEEGGKLTEVDGLEPKLSAVLDDLLGVTRLIISASQLDEARELLSAARPARSVELIPAATTDELIPQAFPAPLDFPAQWRTAQGCLAALHPLRAISAPGASAHSWTPVANALEHLSRTLPGGEAPAAEAGQLLAIARRHLDNSGDYVLPVNWRTLPKVSALSHLAHALQSKADYEPDQLGPLIELAQPLLPVPRESDLFQLRVHGALGRAELLLGQVVAAEDRLRSVVLSWAESAEFLHEASRALSAWLRARGLLGEESAVREAVNAYLSFEPALSEDDRAFGRLAAARALIQVGASRLAMEHLEARELTAVPIPHVAASRERWKAAALEALGHPTDAARARDKAVQFQMPSGTLALLDEALRQDKPTEELAREIMGKEKLASWYCAHESPNAARRFAREYPY